MCENWAPFTPLLPNYAHKFANDPEFSGLVGGNVDLRPVLCVPDLQDASQFACRPPSPRLPHRPSAVRIRKWRG